MDNISKIIGRAMLSYVSKTGKPVSNGILLSIIDKKGISRKNAFVLRLLERKKSGLPVYVDKETKEIYFVKNNRKKEIKRKESQKNSSKNTFVKQTPSFQSNIQTKAIPWNAIEFGENHIYLYNFIPDQRDSRKIQILKEVAPFIIDNPMSRKSFNMIKEYISSMLPRIKVRVKNNRIIGLTAQPDLRKAIQILSDNSKEYEAWDENNPIIKDFPLSSSFRKALTTDQDSILRKRLDFSALNLT